MLDRELHAPSALVLAAEAIALRNVRLRSFLLRLLDPEDLGHAVSHEVRQEALRLVLGETRSNPDAKVTSGNGTCGA